MSRKSTRYYSCPHCEACFPLVGTSTIPPHSIRLLDAYPAMTYRTERCPGSGQPGLR